MQQESRMELTEFLEHLNRGIPVEGGCEVHQFMHGVSQEALRLETAR